MTIYSYPADLDKEIQPYFQFKARKWVQKGKKTINPRRIIDTEGLDVVRLPMSTNGLIEAFGHNWEEGTGLGASTFTDAFLKNILGKVSDSFGDLGRYYSVKKGLIVNDYAGLSYSGTNFRIFDFVFSLTPKNQNESNIIKEIVKVFKRHSLPKYNDKFIDYPRYWAIDVIFPGANDFIQIQNCVCTNVSFNYFPDSTFNVLQDGSPVKTEIALNFKELEKIDRRLYE